MLNKNVCVFLSLFILAGCGKKKIDKIENQSIKNNNDVVYSIDERPVTAHENRHYTLTVQGIECAWCAQAAINQLKSLDGVVNVKFLTTPISEDEKALIALDWKYPELELDAELVKKRLASEGFTFISMHELEKIA
jgi:copper chaperone CopZ